MAFCPQGEAVPGADYTALYFRQSFPSIYLGGGVGVGALKKGLLGVYWSPSAFFRVSQVWGFCGPWLHSGGSWSHHRSEASRALLPQDNAGKSRHNIPIPSFPTLFSHGPAAFCPRPRSTPTGSKEFLAHPTSSLSRFLCHRQAVQHLLLPVGSMDRQPDLPGKFFEASPWTDRLRFCVF